MCENGRYAVEIMTTDDSFGRKFYDSKASAEKAFAFLEKNLGRFTDFDFVANLLTASKNISALDELSFMFLVFGKTLSQVQIGKLIDKFQLKIKSKVSKDKTMTIKIYFGDKFLGYFMGTFTKKDFSFFLS